MYLMGYNVSRKVHMSDDPKSLPAAFYRSANGTEPVRDWFKGLQLEDRRIVGHDIATAEFA